MATCSTLLISGTRLLISLLKSLVEKKLPTPQLMVPRCIHMASHSKAVVIGSFLNISVLADWLMQQDAPVLIFCASWKDRFSLEDTVFAGALAERLMNSGKFETICDGVTASIDLWSLAKNDLFAYIQKAAQKSRLASKGLDDCIEYCLTDDLCPVIPIFQDEKLIDILKSM